MNRTKHLLLDMDHVVGDYMAQFHTIWNRTHPDKPLQQCEGHTSKYLRHVYPDQDQELMERISHDPEFFSNMPVIEGAQEGVAYLQSKYIVTICSSPSISREHCVTGKYQFLETQFGEELARHAIFTKDKSAAKGDYLVDDDPEWLTRGRFTPTWDLILFDAPHNRHVKDIPRIDWETVYEIL